MLKMKKFIAQSLLSAILLQGIALALAGCSPEDSFAGAINGYLEVVNYTDSSLDISIDGSFRGTLDSGESRTWHTGSGKHIVDWGSGGTVVDVSYSGTLELR